MPTTREGRRDETGSGRKQRMIVVIISKKRRRALNETICGGQEALPEYICTVLWE
jgi:hypothetical protein